MSELISQLSQSLAELTPAALIALVTVSFTVALVSIVGFLGKLVDKALQRGDEK